MQKLFSRMFQTGAKGVAHFLDWKEPECFIGEGEFEQFPKVIQDKKITSLLIVTDPGIREAGLLESFTKHLEALHISYDIYDGVRSNPTVAMCEEIAIRFNKMHGDAMIGVGGGSVIDAMKGAGILVTQPEKSLEDFRGLLKVRKDTPRMIAVPTTAGTGSEATLATVLSSPNKREKYAIMDTVLIPDMAVLDPTLTKSLPKNLVAGPGMDALTHAVEAYIGQGNTKQTEAYSLKAVELISNNIEKVYKDKENTAARQNMLLASYYAGRAFTRAYVGYVHALSHALTAFYGVAHGRTNATVLPIILKMYGSSVTDRLNDLADAAGISRSENTPAENAQLFIEWIEYLNEQLGIAKYIPEIQDEDLKDIATHAENEANPLYPVPEMYAHADLVDALKRVQGSNN